MYSVSIHIMAHGGLTLIKKCEKVGFLRLSERFILLSYDGIDDHCHEGEEVGNCQNEVRRNVPEPLSEVRKRISQCEDEGRGHDSQRADVSKEDNDQSDPSLAC